MENINIIKGLKSKNVVIIFQDQKRMAIAWTSWECEKKEERCSRIAVPRLASRSFRTRAWSPSTLSPRRSCTRHEDSSCNIKVGLTSWERRSIRFFLFFPLKSNLSEIDGTRYEQTIAQWIFHPEITLTNFFLEHKRVRYTISFPYFDFFDTSAHRYNVALRRNDRILSILVFTFFIFGQSIKHYICSS